MIETSKDLLYVVISFCVLWLTVFLCWVLYYIAMMLKQGYDLARGVKEKMKKVESLIDLAKSRLEKSSSHLALVAEGVGQLVKYLMSRQEKKKDKKSKVK